MPSQRFGADFENYCRLGHILITDPGDAGEIPLGRRGYGVCPVVTAAAETRTLQTASELDPGMLLLVILQTDGGDLTITGAEASVILTDAGDAVLFVVSDNAGTFAWRIVGSTKTPQIEGNGSTLGLFAPDAQQETIAAGVGGAISVATYLTLIGADAGGDAFTLADGVQIGQVKKITMDDATGVGTVTLTNAADENTLTYDAVGETAELLWNGTGWRIILAYNEATGTAGPGLSTV